MRKGIFLIVCILLTSASAAFAQDADGDGLSDPMENIYGSDQFDPDTDDDGLLDGDEDTDRDGFQDFDETSALDADTDDDGISDMEETFLLLHPLNPDTDNDNLNDGLEAGSSFPIPGGISEGMGIPYYGTDGMWIGDSDPASITDPLDADSDNDGISDGNEDKDNNGKMDASETNPVDADTDDDCLKDGDEDFDFDGVLDMSETDPKDSDTDDDGLKDGLEKGRNSAVPGGTSEGPAATRVTYTGTAAGWTPDADPSSLTDPRDTDTDNDGLTDAAEDIDKDGLLDGSESNPADADTDDDGIKDGDEVTNSLNKKIADTDGDGLNDGLEIGRSAPISGGTSEYLGIAYSGTAVTWLGDSDPASKTDPLDADTDNDGISDGNEDKDHDGNMDASETNPVDADSDDDGLKDGEEDLDDDGVLDATETDPKDPDTDDDGLTDGLEKGRSSSVPAGTSDGSYVVNRVSYYGTAPGWAPDTDPSTMTDPRDADTDNDGLPDGTEDADHDGLVDASESNPNDADTDDDGSPDGVDCNNVDSSIYPGAVEIPGDGTDQNCDGAELCYLDADDDGYRPDASSTVMSADCDCDDPGEAASTDPAGDCVDSDASFYPGAPEGCDEWDKNCDGYYKSSSSESITESACFTYTAPDGAVYTTSGVKVAVVPNADGCDHTITIDLTIKNVDVSVTQDLATLTANASPAEYQWLDCDDGNSPLDGETSQTFTPAASGNYAVKVTQDGCELVSLCYPVVATAIVPENSLTKNLRIYPNPTTGLVTIDLGESIPEIKIVTSDVNGRITGSDIFRDRQLIETYIEGAPGIYNILIIIENKAVNIKLLKN